MKKKRGSPYVIPIFGYGKNYIYKTFGEFRGYRDQSTNITSLKKTWLTIPQNTEYESVEKEIMGIETKIVWKDLFNELVPKEEWVTDLFATMMDVNMRVHGFSTGENPYWKEFVQDDSCLYRHLPHDISKIFFNFLQKLKNILESKDDSYIMFLKARPDFDWNLLERINKNKNLLIHLKERLGIFDKIKWFLKTTTVELGQSLSLEREELDKAYSGCKLFLEEMSRLKV